MSLNRHIAQSYHMDPFSRGFVDILAAEQTPDNSNWFQGTADAVRQASRHFVGYDASYYLILAGDHLYRMDFADLVRAHVDQRADITIAAQPVSPDDATSMGIFLFDRDGQIVGFEEKPNAARLSQMGGSAPPGTALSQRGDNDHKPFIASMGIYVFSHDVLLKILGSTQGTDFGREIIPASLDSHRVKAYLYDGYWADVGTMESFYDANIQLTTPHAPFKFYDPERPIYTHERFLPPSHMRACTVRESLIGDGCFLDACSIEQSVVGIRTHIGQNTKISRCVLLGADTYDADPESGAMGIGRNVTLHRVIMDKNASIGDGARLVNESGVQHADGNGYYIRNGIIIVPKFGKIAPGTVV
jgi:glucose-1-phosphate adenylyltransferase